ncbi:hypothetical protein [Georgenia sp. H159]|uniref:hypothetical protein n=1 Tax=Georgenia sp. H159 TaxID=3076115 RepID=UPI002D78E635|nr:hypothetical protein [Georgenia sp. H159]
MSDRPRALIVSFSPIHRDARVLRQLSVVARHARVTTIGYGPAPAGSEEHLRIPDDAASLPQTVRGVLTLIARRWRAAELASPAARLSLELVAGRRWDMVVANDARALPVAFRLADGAPVWADLHEWAPEERSHVPVWKILVAPLMDHLCRTYLPRCAATTTVGLAISELYEERYGVRPAVMRNTAPWTDLAPTPVDGDTIRLVHSGGAVPGRRLETIIDVADRLGEGYSLDLFLVPAKDGEAYLEGLRERASSNPRVTFHPPVPATELPATLNRFDLGVYWIPPYSRNARLALPNKLFDFVQGRLAIAVGPSQEMESVVREHDLGVVSEDFDVASCVRSVAAMTRDDIARFKSNAHAASRPLSFESDAEVADGVVRTLLSAG